MYICDIYVVMVSSVNKLFVNLAILPPPLLCKEQKSLKHLNDVDWTDQWNVLGPVFFQLILLTGLN